MQTTTYKLNVTPGGVPLTIHISQYDVGLRQYTFQPYTSDGEFTYVSGATVTLEATKPDGYAVIHNCTYNQDGSITYTVQAQLAAVPGRVWSKVVIRNGNNILGTGAVVWMVDNAGVKDNAIVSDSDISALQQWMANVEDYSEAAASSASLAESAVTSAQAAATQAAGYVDQAVILGGTPLVAATVSAMSDHDRVYVYTGSETGYTAGNWYYWNGSAWTSGGIYNSSAVQTDPTLSVSGMAADAAATGELKNELSDITTRSRNLLNGLVVGKGIDGSGNIAEATSLWYYTDYIPAGNIVIKANGSISGYSVNVRVCEYNSSKTFLSRTTYYTNPCTHTPSDNCAYIRMSFYGTVNASETTIESFKYQVEYGSTPTEYVPPITAFDSVARADADAVSNGLENLNNSLGISVINRFNKATASDGYYVESDSGNLAANEDYFASDYIDISDLDSVDCSYTHIIAFYNSAKAFISGQGFNTVNADSSISRPTNAQYIRFSTWLNYKNVAQVGSNVSRTNYVPYGKYVLANLVDFNNVIVVDANGNGDYTSFTEAIYDTVDSGVDVFVNAGTYNIVSEYEALFGASAVANMADSDSATFNGFQYGVILRNRKVEFAPGAHLVCNWTGHTSDGTHRFSALRTDYNVEIVGLHLVSTATFYAIHDDYGLSGTPFTVKYENCYIEGINLSQTNCIGGGCRRYSRHILENCYITNNVTGNTVTARYHNTSDTNAEPEVYIHNCHFNGSFVAKWYGSQTTKMKVYVNNCEARSIYKAAEDAGAYNVDNVVLYKWRNTESNPV